MRRSIVCVALTDLGQLHLEFRASEASAFRLNQALNAFVDQSEKRLGLTRLHDWCSEFPRKEAP